MVYSFHKYNMSEVRNLYLYFYLLVCIRHVMMRLKKPVVHVTRFSLPLLTLCVHYFPQFQLEPCADDLFLPELFARPSYSSSTSVISCYKLDGKLPVLLLSIS